MALVNITPDDSISYPDVLSGSLTSAAILSGHLLLLAFRICLWQRTSKLRFFMFLSFPLLCHGFQRTLLNLRLLCNHLCSCSFQYPNYATPIWCTPDSTWTSVLRFLLSIAVSMAYIACMSNINEELSFTRRHTYGRKFVFDSTNELYKISLCGGDY
ncbi:hypothetical protein CK203_107968 [Vitis vinifera]|uniref:Uncharacterized protein n=1 Tax=Vitis vinifera TaxID=29760 RepID=A0A438BQZ5_VITVI|nr:hypothetical protein CK203_107968 [Vitis vinifera]